MTWKTIKLGDILTESKIPSTENNPDRRISVRLNKQGVEKRALKEERTGATKYYIRKAGQFIYGQQNLHKGAFGIIPQELDGFESSNDLPTFDISDICRPEWLIYFFSQNGFYKTLGGLAKGIGSKRIYPKQVFEIQIPLPTLSEQDEIIQRIDNLEIDLYKLSEINEENEQLVKKLKSSILQDAVQGKLTTQDPSDEPASILIEKIQAEKAKLIADGKTKKQKLLLPIRLEEIPYELPQGWEWVRLGIVADIVRGGSPRPAGDPTYYDGKIPFLKVGDLTRDTNTYLNNYTYTIKEAGLHRTRLVEPNTLLLTNSGATLGVPKICLFETTFNDGIAAFINFSDNICKEYIYYFLFGKTKWFLEVASRGQGQPNLNTDIVGETLLPLPPFQEQKRIVIKINEFMKSCEYLNEEVNQSKQRSEKLLENVLQGVFNS